MKVTRIILPGSAAQLTTPRTLQLTSRVPVDGAPGRFVYTRQVDLRFRLGSDEEPVFNAQATRLPLTFRKLAYDALHPPAGLPAATASGSERVLLTLESPREIASVGLASGLEATLAAAPLGLYRVDRDAPAEKPATKTGGGPGVRGVSSGFVDGRFAIGAEGATGLSSSHIASLGVIGYPTSPRVGMKVPEVDPDGRQAFWQEAGRFHAPGGPGALSVDIGKDLVNALPRALEKISRTPASGPGEFGAAITVPLVFASDEPCELVIGPMEIVYGLTPREADEDDRPDRTVLRFPGGSSATRMLPLSIPAGVKVIAAKLEGTQSFSSEARPAGAALAETPVFASGVRLEPGVRAAQAFGLAAAAELLGITAPLLAVQGRPRITMQVQRDERGRPTGRAEISAEATLMAGDGPRWLSFLFDEPVLTDTSPRWIVLSVAEGDVVWLADEGGVEALGGESGGVLLKATPSGGWSIVPGLVAARRMLVAAVKKEEMPAGLSVRVGDVAVAVPKGENGRLVYDVTAALAAFVAARPGASAEVLFTSSLRGLVSITGVDLRYDRE